jgi:hypothetical protein
MAGMKTADLLTCWEQGQGLPALQGALLALHHLNPHQTPESLLELPIGERDRRLFELRTRLFGPILDIFATCPHCGLDLELSFNSDQLGGNYKKNRRPCFELEGVRVRLLNSADQLAISRMPEDAAQGYIMQHCVQVRDEQAIPKLDGIIEAMLKQDPLAEILLQMQCEGCGHRWPLLLDIVNYLHQELDRHARVILRQVHILAGAYGWSEEAILNMSPERRQTYLEMLAA